MFRLPYLVAQVAVGAYAAAYTWPNHKIDILEELRFEQSGFKAFSPVTGVFPCDTLIAPSPGTGRIGSAEWIRTAYHDMATADTEAGVGGLDASIGFETNRPENVGTAFNDTIQFFQAFQSPRASMADLLAMGALLAAESCSDGAMEIPFRAGRVDATVPEPSGVPEPHQDLEAHTNSFKKQGFNISEMIGLVACGHSLGGVHGRDFPHIVPELNDPKNSESMHSFDPTIAKFDNKIATDFVNNGSQNPLAFGHNETTRSDFRIFKADGGSLIQRMAQSQPYFFEVCTELLARMVDTVPSGVTLTDVIMPVPLKPRHIETTFGPEGITVTGEIRILEDGSTSQDRQIFVHFKPQKDSGHDEIVASTAIIGNTAMEYSNRANFTFYGFNITTPYGVALSKFEVELVDGPNRTMHTNNDAGFPINNDIVLQQEFSCHELEPLPDNPIWINFTVAATAMIRDNMKFDDVQMIVHVPASMPGSFVSRFEAVPVQMTKVATNNSTGFSQYTAKLSYIEQFGSVKTLDIVATGPKGPAELTFLRWMPFPRCP